MGGSDLLTDMKAVDEYARLRSEGTQSEMRKFCEDVSVYQQRLHPITNILG